MTEEQKLDVPEKATHTSRASSDGEETTSAPTTRASIYPSEHKAKVSRRFDKKAKVLMRRTSAEMFEFDMTVTGYEYDSEREGWNYWLDDASGVAWPKMVKETNLKKRR